MDMNYRLLGEPCRNFCILGRIMLHDPLDGREKLVLSSFVSGGTGVLIFIDIETGKGEEIQLPGDEGAWALYNLDDKKLLVGTCAQRGYLHALDLTSRTWLPSLRDENETYIWNLAQGSDGMIYGGTYPSGVLLRYDPDGHKLTNLGKLSKAPGNMYTRTVYGNIPGYLMIVCGYAKKHHVLYDLSSGKFRDFGPDGSDAEAVENDFICFIKDGKRTCYETQQFTEQDPDIYSGKLRIPDRRIVKGMGEPVTLASGSLAGVRGQQYYILHKDSRTPELHNIPASAPLTRIHNIIPGPDGCLWGSTSFGQTIFSFYTTSGEYINSQTVCDKSGEVYGMRFSGNRLFMSAYSGGDHIVYDTDKPWDQFNNVNPKTLESVSPELIRPTGRSIIGPDGNFWTGWSAKYGVYGGGIARVCVDTLEMKCWYDPVPQQGISWIGCDDEYIYFTTNGSANGLPTKQEPFYLVMCDTDGRIISKSEFPEGALPGPFCCMKDMIYVSTTTGIHVFKGRTLESAGTIDIVGICEWMSDYDDNTCLAFIKNKVYAVTSPGDEIKLISELPGPVSCACVSAKRAIYFACGSKLYELTIKP